MPASINDKFLKVGVAGTLTTLAAPGKALAASSINVASTTNWPTDTAVIFAIRQVDSSGALVPGTYTEWKGVVGSNTITGLVLVYGDDQAYTAGATTQVYMPLSAYRDNSLVDGILVGHNQDGSHKANLEFETPELNGTGWADFGQGWTAGTGTWTYTGASGASSFTMTVPAADAAMLAIGSKIKLTQTTAKYFYVVGISGTTLTITAGNGYTLASAPITNPFFSNAASPAGFPQWFNFTPTLAGWSANPASGIYRFSMVGRQVKFEIGQSASGTSNNATTTVTLPVAAANITNYAKYGPCRMFDNGVNLTTAAMWLVQAAGTTVAFYKDFSQANLAASGTKQIVWASVEYEV